MAMDSGLVSASASIGKVFRNFSSSDDVII